MIPIPLDQIINAIKAIATPVIKNKLERNEKVIKLLKQFNLDPDHPPADFSGVYAYALVQYGVGQPKEILELFRQEEIKKAFRKAFEQRNFSILLAEGEAFLKQRLDLAANIQNQEIDPYREFAAFAAAFIEVANSTRTPAETLTNQRIDSIYRNIVNLIERLERLPTLEGIRTELARLAAQNSLVIPTAEPSTEKKCRAFALAQQMRGWFETLGYDFEKHEVWEEEHFEWIINIPGRRGYNRIVVRGIEGEAGLSEVVALRQSVDSDLAPIRINP